MGLSRITVLPEQDKQRLVEISSSGTLAGDGDLLRMIKYLASAIAVVGEGQEQTADGLQKVADAAGVGR